MVTPFYDPGVAANGITYEVSQSAANTTFGGQQKVIYGQPINGVYGAGQNGAPVVGGLNYTSSSISGS